MIKKHFPSERRKDVYLLQSGWRDTVCCPKSSEKKSFFSFLFCFFFLSFFVQAEKLQLQHWKPSSHRISTRPESTFHETSLTHCCAQHQFTCWYVACCLVLLHLPSVFSSFFQTLSSLQSVRGVTSLVRGRQGGRGGGESGSSPGRHFTSVSVWVVWGE